MKNQGHVSTPKRNNNPPISKFKSLQFYDFADKESKISVLRKLNQLQENIERQFNQSGKYFMNKMKSLTEIEIIKKNQQ